MTTTNREWRSDMHRVKPHQSVRILTIQFAVPADEDENAVCDGIVELLDGDIEREDGVILDWRYVFGEERVVQAGDDPGEGDVFYLTGEHPGDGHGSGLNAEIAALWAEVVAEREAARPNLTDYVEE